MDIHVPRICCDHTVGLGDIGKNLYPDNLWHLANNNKYDNEIMLQLHLHVFDSKSVNLLQSVRRAPQTLF